MPRSTQTDSVGITVRTFIDQWCRALGRHGVEKLYLGVDKTKRENFVWQKKPNPSYYHLELSEEQIGDRWEDAVARCRCVLDVEQIPVTAPLPNGDRLGRVQRPFFRKVRRRAKKDGYDFVLSCDVDEFPVMENQLTLPADLIWQRKYSVHRSTAWAITDGNHIGRGRGR